MITRSRGLMLIPVLLALFSSAHAELRPPTAAEKAVLDKYRTVINQILDQCRSDDWDEKVDYEVSDDVYVHPNSGRPLDVNEMFQRSYDVHYGSDRFNKKVLPPTQKLQETSDMKEKMKYGAEAQKSMRLRIEVHFNYVEASDIEPPPGENPDLKISGAAFAYKTKNHVTDANSGAAILGFGNWQPLKWDSDHKAYYFHFVHPVNSPYIENVVINFYGASDRIDELLHSIDWTKVNDAMTR